MAQSFVRLHTVTSTNNYLAKLVSPQLMEGAAIFTDEQTAGKGQNGTHWLAEPAKNILTSVFFRPKFLLPEQQFYLSQAVALAVYDFLCFYLPQNEVLIKYPNDVYFQNKKIAGILIENTLSGTQIVACIVGVGININQVLFENGLDTASSLKKITGKTYDLEELMAQFYGCLEARYLALKSGGFTKTSTEFTRNMLGYQTLRSFEVLETGVVFEGEILGVAAGGRLAILHKNKIELFGTKTLKFIF